MHDKSICAKCKYHGGKRGTQLGIYCNYASVNKKCCLKLEHGTVIDTRGEGKCRLYEEGAAINSEEE